MRKPLLMSGLLALAFGVASTAANSQIIVFDFDSSDGGWTQQTLVGAQAWSWSAAGAGWSVDNSSAVSQARLLSPLFVTTGTSAAITITHRYNFEPNGVNCFDGGNWKLSVNGGGFGVGFLDTGGYIGTISGSFGNPMAGEDAWCGQSAGWAVPQFVLAQESGNVVAGTTFQFAFDAGWDSSVLTSSPNWEITGIELRGFQLASAVPEPGTLALLGLGLAGLAASRRRKQ